MLKKKLQNLLFVLICVLNFVQCVHTTAEEENVETIVLWHALDGFLEKQFLEIVSGFNQSVSNYRIIAQKKENYSKLFEQGIEAHRKGEGPQILQVYEVATKTMHDLGDEYYVPVDDLMHQYNRLFDPEVYITPVRKFYSFRDQTSGLDRMFSLPWNASTGVVFYNKDSLKKAGWNPSHLPETWEDMADLLGKLKDKGLKGFTTAWPAAYHLEHYSARHNLPFATLENGYREGTPQLLIDSPQYVAHLSDLVKWSKTGEFVYQGRFTEEPEAAFTSGDVSILMNGGNRYPMLKGKAKFEIVVGPYPYRKSITHKPHSLNIGGGSFWALKNSNPKIYQGVTQFFSYLSSAEVQGFWHQKTGYLPITDAAYYLSKKKGFYKENPAAEVATLSVMAAQDGTYTHGVRFGDYINIRNMIIDQLEEAFYGRATPKEALKKAVQTGNQMLATYPTASQ